jgi:hypothetical protein
MIFKNPKTQKIISSLLVILILITPFFLVKPKTTESSGIPVVDILGNIWDGLKSALISIGSTSQVTDTTISIKNVAAEIFRQALMAVARKALQEITKSTVNWINSGFHGNPLYIENASSFFEDIAKSEVKNLVDMFGYDSLKYPFGKDFALNTINTYKNQLENNASYSLSRVVNDPTLLKNYQNNFNVGGWDVFLINTQYPQNNYLGFQMVATEELARRVQGTAQTAAQKVQTTLQQGMGFLAPQTCPSNPSYNNGTNEFQKPSFNISEYNKTHPYKCNDEFPDDDDGWETCDAVWKDNLAVAKREWGDSNTCPGGLVSTTPGYVVANQITTAMGSQFRQSELGAALGNSLSTVFDALLNKFIGDGLKSLASEKNTRPVTDDWSYNGLTLGSPGEGGSNYSWDSGPDEEVDLIAFKKQLHGKTIIKTKNPTTGEEEITEEIGNTTVPGDTTRTYVPGDIANTETEIIFLEIMPKIINNTDKTNLGIVQIAQTLDQCIPGPDKAWEDRLKEEQQRVTRIIQNDQDSDDPLKVKASNETIRELRFAVEAFMEWVNDRMSTELPNSILYMDTIKSINDFSQQLQETTNAKRTKSQTLARLKAIAGNEKAVIKTGLASISTQPEPGSTAERTMVALKKQYNYIRSSISNSFTIEETRSRLDMLNDKKNNIKSMTTECMTQRVAAGWEEIGGDKSKQDNITEMEKFCTIPIVSGYSHGVVIRNDQASRLTNCPANPGGCGRVVDGVSTFDTTGWFSFRNPNIDTSIPTRDGEFEPQPADLGNPGYEDLPMVNAKNVYGDDDKISVEIDCNLIFRANPTDYTLAGDKTF